MKMKYEFLKRQARAASAELDREVRGFLLELFFEMNENYMAFLKDERYDYRPIAPGHPANVGELYERSRCTITRLLDRQKEQAKKIKSFLHEK